MLRFLPTFVCLLAISTAVGQVPLCAGVGDTTLNSGTLADVDEPPTFPGGERAMLKYLDDNMQKIHTDTLCGTAFFQFHIAEDGTIDDVCILRRTCAALESEGARVIKAMPKWDPAKRDGAAVPVLMRVPIRID